MLFSFFPLVVLCLVALTLGTDWINSVETE